MAKKRELTPKQKRFCEEYLKDLNATQAAARAGYSKKTAMEQGYQLLQIPLVSAQIEELLKARSKRTAITADVILGELLLIAKADLSEAYDNNGKFLPMHKMPESIRRSISSVDVFEELERQGQHMFHVGDTKKLKLWDKNKALELLGKHLKLFTEKVEHSGTVTLEQLITGSGEKE